MTYVGRLKGVGALLALAAVLTNSHVWGESDKKSPPQRAGVNRHAIDKADQSFEENLAKSKFASGGLATYRTIGGDLLFALQVKPKLEATPERPRDYLVMIDTSASQVKGPLTAAGEFAETLAATLKAGDRMAIWTANTPSATRNLTHGFAQAKTAQITSAFAALKQEVPLGDTDLKGALKKAVATFERAPGRQQIILFLGDGMSVHDPITDSDRAGLCEEMVKSGVAFYPVPLGPRLDPKNLHGLATGTGGAAVRLLPDDKPGDALKRLADAVSTSVLYPKSFQLGNEVAESYPAVLPPLRADAPTLVVGRLKAGDAIRYTLEGTVADRDVQVKDSVAVTAAEADNFFLIGMVEQWKGGKDQPALIRADRALAYAFEQTQLVHADLLDQAGLALQENKLDAASDLFQKAKKLDPADVEADAGLKVVQKLKAGVLTKEQLRDQLARADKSGLQGVARAVERAQPPAIAPPVDQDSLLQEQKRRVAVEEQRTTPGRRRSSTAGPPALAIRSRCRSRPTQAHLRIGAEQSRLDRENTRSFDQQAGDVAAECGYPGRAHQGGQCRAVAPPGRFAPSP